MIIKNRWVKRNIIVKSTLRSLLLSSFGVFFTCCLMSTPAFAKASLVMANAYPPGVMPDEEYMSDSLNLKGVDEAKSVSVKDGEVVLIGTGAKENTKLVSKKPKTQVVTKKPPHQPDVAAIPPKKMIVVEKPRPVVALPRKIIVVEKPKPVITAPKKIVVVEKPTPVPAPVVAKKPEVPKKILVVEKPIPVPTPVAAKKPTPKPVIVAAPPKPSAAPSMPIVSKDITPAEISTAHLTPVIVNLPKPAVTVAKPKPIEKKAVVAVVPPKPPATKTIPNVVIAKPKPAAVAAPPMPVVSRQITPADISSAHMIPVIVTSPKLTPPSVATPPKLATSPGVSVTLQPTPPAAVVIKKIEPAVREQPPAANHGVIVHESSGKTNNTGAYTNDDLTATGETIDYSAFDQTNENDIKIEDSAHPAVKPATKPAKP